MEIVKQEVAAQDVFLADVSEHQLTVGYGPVYFVEFAADDPSTDQMIAFDDDAAEKGAAKRYGFDLHIVGLLNDEQLQSLLGYLGGAQFALDLLAGINLYKSQESEAGISDSLEVSTFSLQLPGVEGGADGGEEQDEVTTVGETGEGVDEGGGSAAGGGDSGSYYATVEAAGVATPLDVAPPSAMVGGVGDGMGVEDTAEQLGAVDSLQATSEVGAGVGRAAIKSQSSSGSTAGMSVLLVAALVACALLAAKLRQRRLAHRHVPAATPSALLGRSALL
jgi:hypothetical protein